MKVLDGGFCSNCYNHVLDQPVVEFDASWDGPVVDSVSIDELALCKSCISSASELLNVDPQLMTDALVATERAERNLARWKDYAAKLELNYASRPEPLKRSGRPPKAPA